MEISHRKEISKLLHFRICLRVFSLLASFLLLFLSISFFSFVLVLLILWGFNDVSADYAWFREEDMLYIDFIKFDEYLVLFILLIVQTKNLWDVLLFHRS